jgi:hypothetical protein
MLSLQCFFLLGLACFLDRPALLGFGQDLSTLGSTLDCYPFFWPETSGFAWQEEHTWASL